jgi:hypothetical protein
MSLPEACLGERIGETRAAVLSAGRLVEMHIARASDGLQPGAVVGARLAAGGLAEACGETIRLAAVPPGLAKGALIRVEIVRAAIAERHRLKPARGLVRGRAEAPGLLREAPSLAERLAARAIPVREGWPAHVSDQWQEALAQARLGETSLATGRVSFVPTPAGLAVDIDGDGPALAREAAAAVGRMIRLFGIGGSVLVDFPSLDRAGRAAAAAALDAALAGLAFERTAVNGFGLMQVVLPRSRPSVVERLWFSAGETQALDLLEAALSDHGQGPLAIHAPPAAAAFLGRHGGLVAEAARRLGRRLGVKPLAGAGTGHVAPA